LKDGKSKRLNVKVRDDTKSQDKNADLLIDVNGKSNKKNKSGKKTKKFIRSKLESVVNKKTFATKQKEMISVDKSSIVQEPMDQKNNEISPGD